MRVESEHPTVDGVGAHEGISLYRLCVVGTGAEQTASAGHSIFADVILQGA